LKKISHSQLPRACYCCCTAAARVQESQDEIDVLSFFLSSSSAAGWFPSSVALISCLNPQKFEILQYSDVDQQKEKAPETCRCNCNKAGSNS
jgi:hypothetical protein